MVHGSALWGYYEAKLGPNILIFKRYITIYQTLILCTYILKFSKHIIGFARHMLVLQTDINCFFKKVPYRLKFRRLKVTKFFEKFHHF